MSVNFHEVWQVLAPRVGAIAAFLLGSTTGGLLMSKNFTLQKGDFSFSTNTDEHALQLMKQSYKDRTKHLLDKSKRNLMSYESDSTTFDAKTDIVETTIDYYLTPTSHDKLFSKDIVIFNGKGKPTILIREDFDEIKDNWSRLLSAANVKKCVDNHRKGEDFFPYDKAVSEKACKDCMRLAECFEKGMEKKYDNEG